MTVLVCHFHAEEAEVIGADLRERGFDVRVGPDDGDKCARRIKAAPPDAVLIYLRRRPSHGRSLANWLWTTKAVRHVPHLFVDGAPDKVARAKADFPHVPHCVDAGLQQAVDALLAQPWQPPPPPASGSPSRRPLSAKLGLKAGMRCAFVDAPPDYARTLGELPEGVEIPGSSARADLGVDLVQLFVTSRSALAEALPGWREAVFPSGMIWVSWPKRASKVPTDITEDAVRDVALPMGLVDVKVCAVDEVWSGLKLVVPVRLRGAGR